MTASTTVARVHSFDDVGSKCNDRIHIKGALALGIHYNLRENFQRSFPS